MRRTGKTTRLIDQAIQSLFNNGQLYLLRKHAVGNFRNIIKNGSTLFVDPDHKMSNMAQNEFVYRVMKRLEFEHTQSCTMKMNKDYIHIKTK